jgi:tetratricopeptide (TPR) repeat protein
MNRKLRSPALIICVAALAFASAGCNKLKARDSLNKGVAAYKGGQFDTAIEHFKTAKQLDPQLLNARLYLATAYASQYIPGAPSEENVRNGEQAIAEFQEVLTMDAQNLSAIDGIGSILFQMGGVPYDTRKFEESRKFHQMHIRVRPEDPEPYYWVGVINWTMAFRANGEMRNEYKNKNVGGKPLKDDQPLPPKLREDFVAKYAAIVDEGIDHLKKGMERRADYEDAMAYLNLLYRQKADMAATPEEREEFLRMADELVDRVKAIKQKKLEAPAHPAPE